jgi:hypothetical protein
MNGSRRFENTSAFIFKGHDTKAHVLTLTMTALRHLKTSEIIRAMTQRHTRRPESSQKILAYWRTRQSFLFHPPSLVSHSVTTYQKTVSPNLLSSPSHFTFDTRAVPSSPAAPPALPNPANSVRLAIVPQLCSRYVHQLHCSLHLQVSAVFLTTGSQTLFSPATRTSRTNSPAAHCCPEDERLAFNPLAPEFSFKF